MKSSATYVLRPVGPVISERQVNLSARLWLAPFVAQLRLVDLNT